ncbi:MAG: hypothetical protein MI700_08995, partial [Balneolales bacterium]|nr:hypothetical protein [Balneolales bacterium]
RALSRSMLQYLDAFLIISGRNPQKLKALSDQLHSEFPDKEHSTLLLDATNRDSLLGAMKNVEFVIVAATIPDQVELVAECALQTGTNLMDIFVRNDVIERLKAFEEDFQHQKLVCFTQCGFHPGIIAPLIKYLSPSFDEYQSAKVAMAMDPIFEKPEAIQEIFFELIENNSTILENGNWRPATYKDSFTASFSPHFGTKTCYPLRMEEITGLDKSLGLKEAGVYAAGFSFFVDYIVFPLAMILGKINPGLAQKVGGWMMYVASKKHMGQKLSVELILVASGLKGGQPKSIKLQLTANDGFALTALPLITLIKQFEMATGKVSGIHLMGDVIQENHLVKDLRESGIRIDVIDL